MSRRALRSYTVERLERFKATQPPYGVVAPVQSTAQLHDERAARIERERVERNRAAKLARAARAGASLTWRRGLNRSGQPGYWVADLPDGRRAMGANARVLVAELEALP